jgi:hypothetical protein
MTAAIIQLLNKNMTIYLYAKQHRDTGLRYFGKTKSNPYTYKGSGTYWKRHLKTHGNNVETTWVQAYEDEAILKEEALFFSKIYNIVEDKAWANLEVENGLDGKCNLAGTSHPCYGRKVTEEQKAIQRAKMTGRKQSEETIAKRVAKIKGQTRPSHSEYMKQWWAERKMNNLNCQIGKEGKTNAEY